MKLDSLQVEPKQAQEPGIEAWGITIRLPAVGLPSSTVTEQHAATSESVESKAERHHARGPQCENYRKRGTDRRSCDTKPVRRFRASS